jgi:glycosyltransferase involved in cell wall biosynthesis
VTRVATVVTYRLGGTDGVAVEARKWHDALASLGFRVRRVAGELVGGPSDDDIELPFLAIDSDLAPDDAALRAAIAGSDLVIADNICSLPLNVAASRGVARVLDDVAARDDARVLLRHHDLPWQRRQLRDLGSEFPPRIAGALHVTINLRSRRELIAREYDLVATVHNHFDLDAPLGDRVATRAAFGFADDDIVCFQPTRAIERKNVPGGVRVVTALRARLARLMPGRHVRYWLTGPAEDGYGPTLERVLARSPVTVTLGRAPSPADGYAASDLVLFPSTWEGFGNPVIESVWARRPLVVFPYPVLAEIQACGLEFFSTDEVDEVARFLVHPDAAYLDRQLRRARVSFSLDLLPGAIEFAFATAGWAW